MPSLARVDLESLLHARKLGGTLTSTWPLQPPVPSGVVPTGHAKLDEWLGGGFPHGQISEIVGPPSSGRTGLLCGVLASVTCRGELAALVDTSDTFDPVSAAAAGVELSRVLWIRGVPGSTPLREKDAVDGAVKALNLVLQAGGFSAVVLDLADVPFQRTRELPLTTWRRLQRVVEGRETACVLLSSVPLARSPGGLSVRLDPLSAGVGWRGTSDRARLLDRRAARALVVRARYAAGQEKGIEIEHCQIFNRGLPD